MNILRRAVLPIVLSICSDQHLVWADDDQPEQDDPPGRVARLQYQTGIGLHSAARHGVTG